jgi:hypothetical protein
MQISGASAPDIREELLSGKSGTQSVPWSTEFLVSPAFCVTPLSPSVRRLNAAPMAGGTLAQLTANMQIPSARKPLEIANTVEPIQDGKPISRGLAHVHRVMQHAAEMTVRSRRRSGREAPMAAWVYVNTSEQVGDKNHLKVFAK